MAELIKRVVMVKLLQNIFNTMQADLEAEGSWLTVPADECLLYIFQMLENGGVSKGWRALGPPWCLLAEELCSGSGWVPAPAVPPAVSFLGLLPSILVLARGLSATLEQQLTTEPAEQVYNSIFRTTIFHLMTLGLKRFVINWIGAEKAFTLSMGKHKKWAGKSR